MAGVTPASTAQDSDDFWSCGVPSDQASGRLISLPIVFRRVALHSYRREGWFIHPLFAAGIFILVVGYYAGTSDGIHSLR
jgi:hypothetical protein